MAHLKLQILNPPPQTPNPKPQTPNPKLQTPNPKSGASSRAGTSWGQAGTQASLDPSQVSPPRPCNVHNYTRGQCFVLIAARVHFFITGSFTGLPPRPCNVHKCTRGQCFVLIAARIQFELFSHGELEPSASSLEGTIQPHGGVRLFHRKSTRLSAIDFRALCGARMVTSTSTFCGDETLKVHRVVELKAGACKFAWMN